MRSEENPFLYLYYDGKNVQKLAFQTLNSGQLPVKYKMAKQILKNSNIRKTVGFYSVLLCFFVFILQTKGQRKDFNTICAAYVKGYNAVFILHM